MKLKILITGATGFIGQHLVKKLKNENQLYCIVREPSKFKEGGVSVIKQDFLKPLNLGLLPKKLDTIVHLAHANTKDVTKLYRVDLNSTFELLEYGKKIGIKTFIYASTGNVYGMSKKKLKETDSMKPDSFYAFAKYVSEILGRHYQDYFNVINLRLFTPYGPDQQESQIIPALIQKVKKGEQVFVYNNGNPRLSPLYIDDVIEVIKRTLILKKSCTINVGGNKDYSIKDISDLIGMVCGKNPLYKFVTDETKAGDLTGDNSLMKRLLKYSPRISLEEGIRKMIKEDIWE